MEIIYATQDEVIDEARRLAPERRKALLLTARRLIPGTSFNEPMDLLHEALALAFDLRRRWPLHIDYALFLATVMSSLARLSRRRARAHVEFDAEALVASVHTHGCARRAAPEADLVAPSAEGVAAARESRRLAWERFERLRTAFARDLDALAILEGMADDAAPSDIRQRREIDPLRYDSARKRLSRAISKMQGALVDSP